MANANLTAEDLRKLFTYNSVTGEFVRLKTNRSITCKDARGYLVCRINGKQYKCHRLAWFYIYGYVPAFGVDHIDGDKANNSIANLREATQVENSQNMKKERLHGSSGMLGVSFASGRWQARIRVNGKNVYLGLFNEKEDAYSAYVAYKRKNHIFCTI